MIGASRSDQLRTWLMGEIVDGVCRTAHCPGVVVNLGRLPEAALNRILVRIPMLLSVARTQIQTDLNPLQMGALLTAVVTTDLNTERLKATPFSLGGVSYLETVWPN